jgi:hypothetical protein
VSHDLLPFMVGQSLDSCTLLSVKDVMLFPHCAFMCFALADWVYLQPK